MTLPRPYVAFRASGKRFARWEFYVHDDEDSSEMAEPARAWELIAPWGFEPHNSKLVRHSVFEFRTILADDWRRGCVLLAGDAAHQMPPFQGQGMCSGQRDAAALAWRLDLVLRGVSHERLLDSYTPERRPHVLTLTENSAERAREYWLTDPLAAHERDMMMIAGLARPDLTKGHGSVPPLTDGVLDKRAGTVIPPAGTLSAQFAVRHRGAAVLLDDLVGANWLVLCLDRDMASGLDDSHMDILNKIGARIVVLERDSEDAEYGDIGDQYMQWLAGLGFQAVIVRPDSYIFGAARDASELSASVASLEDQLSLLRTEVDHAR